MVSQGTISDFHSDEDAGIAVTRCYFFVCSAVQCTMKTFAANAFIVVYRMAVNVTSARLGH